MSWVPMLNGWQWALMAAVPPLIIMLYFLKLRRMPVEVPSTYLWQKTIEDLHVNSIWQRLRKNILLLLQLLVVLALILACLRPGIRGDASLGQRSIFMIDNSSSMQASDVGNSRLQEAKDRALEYVQALGRNDVGMVIAFSDRADVRQGFTSDKSQLRDAINSITATNRTTDLNEALRAASGLANPGRTSQIEDLNDIQVAEALPASLYIFSDGGFSPPQVDLGNLAAEYVSIGDSASINVGIVAFTADRNAENESEIEAFALVQNFSDSAVTVTASLSLDGELIDASEVEIDALANTGVSFDIQNIVEGQLKLELEHRDHLQVDNVAFAGLDPPRQLEVVLVTYGNSALEAALATQQAMSLATVRIIDPDSLDSDDVKAMAASGNVDLFIYDGCAPEQLPESNTLFVGSMPPNDEWSASEPAGPLFVIDVNRAHPMLQYVDVGTVRIVEGQALELPPGGTELVRTDQGILIGIAPREAYQDAVVAMPLLKREGADTIPNTDWSRKRSFPVFVLNALEYLGGAVSTASARTVQPGQPAVLNLASRFEEVEVTDPAGRKTTLTRNRSPQLIYTQTDQPGFYLARPKDSDRLLQMFTVNLFSDQESDILPAKEVRIGTQDVAAAAEQTEIVRVEYWRWLLTLALVILAVEWVLYNRRVAV